MTRYLLLLLFLALPAFGASWKSEGPFFGVVQSIAIDNANPNRLWVSTHGGGVWRSTDGGATWSLAGALLSDRVVSYVALQPKSNTLWAGVERQSLARSKDGGDTWEWVRHDLAYTPYPPAFDPANPKSIWIADVNLHKRSSDAGAKWTEFRVSGGDVVTFAIHPTDSKTLWAGGNNQRAGLWKTTDGGASWRQIGKGLPESNGVKKLVVDHANPDHLYMGTRLGGYRSTDGGETWVVFGGSIPQDEEIESLTMHPSSPETLFAGTQKGFFKTTDGAQTWTRVTGGLPRYIIRALAIHPTTPDVMWAGAAGAGIYKTTDGGKSWTESNNGFAASWIDKVWGNTTGLIVAETSRGLMRTTGNRAWTDVGKPFAGSKTSADIIIFDPRSPNTIHAGDSASYFRSTDAGATWTEVVKPFQDPRPEFDSLVFDPRNPKIVYAADDSSGDDDPAIFKSVDGGVKWKAAAAGIKTPGILVLRGDPNGALLALGKEGGLWRSTDGATTWTAAGTGLPTKDMKDMFIDPANASAVYVITKDAFYRSEDGGATFSQSNKGVAEAPYGAVAVDATGNVYLATREGVFRSGDAGKTWSTLNEGLTNIDTLSIYSAGTRLYVGTAGGGVFSIDLR